MLDSLTAARPISTRRVARTATWQSDYRWRLALTDALAIGLAVAASFLVAVALDSRELPAAAVLPMVVRYGLVSVVVSLAWGTALHTLGTRDHRIVGADATEYRRVINATVIVFGLLAVAAYLYQGDLRRVYVLTAFCAGLAALLTSRWLWRRWLTARRAAGEYSYRMLLVGSEASVRHLEQDLRRNPSAGYRVVGACVLNARGGGTLPGTDIPLWSDLGDISAIVEQSGADTVAVTSSDDLPPERVRELSWELEPGRRHLVVAPSLTDVAGPRVHARPVSGLPLLHVETPRYEGRPLYSKRVFDIVVSSALLVALAPLFLAIAIAIKATSSGPVLFSQLRVGKKGTEFRMLKFRSMVTDAEERLSALQSAARDRGNEILFKMKDDPRVTPVGRILRRYSLDELPQLINVWRGEMSLVGPRPPLPREVERYEARVNRRFLVKPGITGLWQVSGRSDLSWEESVRLDLYYVENWSMTGDLAILWKTARAVVAPAGAY
ncbi:sugar transferase [Naasia sp. SYSU D00948]|uniref:sugar transferase n=1 Tax=Naasia sp. SYSU D00948 TaxID=2817379 RepID=UPI001B3171B2|nr:sugar transferase [Naasia sp. SYSU D00948]